jgi:hypothetical protein
MNPDDTLLHDIVRALATVECCAPHELQFALHDYVDTTAIERLAAMDDAEWSLSFDVPDHVVAVHSDGRIVVDDAVIHGESELDASGST